MPPRSCQAQGQDLPLHYAAKNQASEAVVAALLKAYPDAAKVANTPVRSDRGCTRIAIPACCVDACLEAALLGAAFLSPCADETIAAALGL